MVKWRKCRLDLLVMIQSRITSTRCHNRDNILVANKFKEVHLELSLTNTKMLTPSAYQINKETCVVEFMRRTTFSMVLVAWSISAIA